MGATPEVVVNIDCADPDRLADFWAAALGYERSGGMGQYRAIRPVEGAPTGSPKLLFQAVPEPKSGKNRVHLDLDLPPGEPLAPEVERLAALGATARTLVEEFGIFWQVMADPEGNEFCVVATVKT